MKLIVIKSNLGDNASIVIDTDRYEKEHSIRLGNQVFAGIKDGKLVMVYECSDNVKDESEFKADIKDSPSVW